jgi:sec-independent protein translocase protein TatA
MSITHILLIAVVALVLFGPNKLPELGRALGRTLRDFKKGANDLMSHVDSPETRNERKDITPPPSSPAAPAASGSIPKSDLPQQEKPADSRRLPD